MIYFTCASTVKRCANLLQSHAYPSGSAAATLPPFPLLCFQFHILLDHRVFLVSPVSSDSRVAAVSPSADLTTVHYCVPENGAQLLLWRNWTSAACELWHQHHRDLVNVEWEYICHSWILMIIGGCCDSCTHTFSVKRAHNKSCRWYCINLLPWKNEFGYTITTRPFVAFI